MNKRIIDFAAELIAKGRNPILAVIDAIQALDPQPTPRTFSVDCVNHQEQESRDA